MEALNGNHGLRLMTQSGESHWLNEHLVISRNLDGCFFTPTSKILKASKQTKPRSSPVALIIHQTMVIYTGNIRILSFRSPAPQVLGAWRPSMINGDVLGYVQVANI